MIRYVLHMHGTLETQLSSFGPNPDLILSQHSDNVVIEITEQVKVILKNKT